MGMDASTLSLTASTIGLAIAIGIGVSSRIDFGYAAVDSGYAAPVLKVMLDFSERIKSANPTLVFTSTFRSLEPAHSNPQRAFVYLVRLGCAVLEEYRYFRANFREVYGEANGRNLCKLLRVFKLWEPLPYDLLLKQPKDAHNGPFEDRRHERLVAVCLRFRTGHISARKSRTGCGRYLHDLHISVPAYLPLDGDGSLRVDVIAEKFFVEEIELLIPGRYDIHRVTKGDIISPFMLHELIQDLGCVNFVEYEDIYCMHRRAFREWTRNSNLCYCIRLACYFALLWSIILSAIIVSTYLSNLHPSIVWSLFVQAICVMFGAAGILLFFEYRRSKYEKLRMNVLLKKAKNERGAMRVAWHTFPPRYSPYRLSELGRSYFL